MTKAAARCLLAHRDALKPSTHVLLLCFEHNYVHCLSSMTPKNLYKTKGLVTPGGVDKLRACEGEQWRHRENVKPI
eukprot:1891766-Amphidinium_carterae.1